MPKIKEGTVTRFQDNLGRRLRVGDTIKDTESGRSYTVISTNTAKSTSDAEQLDLMKKRGRVEAFFMTSHAWDEDSKARSITDASGLQTKLDELQAKYDSLNVTFQKCNEERMNLKTQLDETSALNAQLMEEADTLRCEKDAIAADGESLRNQISRLSERCKELDAQNLDLKSQQSRDAVGEPVLPATASPMDFSNSELFMELERRGITGELKVPTTVWQKVSVGSNAEA